MKLIVIVILLLFVLCFFRLKKECNGTEKTKSLSQSQSLYKKKQSNKSPKKLRYCLKCYTPTRPKDIVCRGCGEVFYPDELEKEAHSKFKIRYCLNCYKPCKPGTVLCEECGYVIRPNYFVKVKNSDKKIRYCVKCYTPCQCDEMICQNCGHELYQ